MVPALFLFSPEHSMAKIETPRKFALPNKFKVATVNRQIYSLTVPADTDITDVTDPTYLASCIAVNDIALHSRIEVVAEKAWWAELLVVAVNKDQKRVWTKLITKPIKLDYDTAAGAQAYSIEPGAAGRVVVRLNRKTIKDFDTKAEAEAWVKMQAA